VTDSFFQKLDSFHSKFSPVLICNGLAPKGSSLEQVKFAKGPKYSQKFVARVFGGFLNTRPSIIVKVLEDSECKMECIYTHINDKEKLNNVFLIQNVMDWPELGKFNCQVWHLGNASVNNIDRHWQNE
jgi:hypothetical protein|tara:strand:+ start:399 stop:782 length:384 start_codon:yes stop_codon:yes gene_type:complete